MSELDRVNFIVVTAWTSMFQGWLNSGFCVYFYYYYLPEDFDLCRKTDNRTPIEK